MGYKYHSWQERRDANNERRENTKTIRAKARKENRMLSYSLLSRLESCMSEAGLTPGEMSDFSGIEPATILRMKRKLNPNTRISTILGIANACGYELKLVKKAPQDDQFRKYRVGYLNRIDPIKEPSET